MRTSSTLLISMMLLSASANLAHAQEGGPPPQLDAAMKALAGNWKCNGKINDSEMGKGHAIISTISVKPDLGKYWYVMRFEEKKTKESPAPYSMMVAIGWDGTKLQRADFDNFGGVTHASSAGWKDGTLVWEGSSQAGPEKTGFRETLTQDKKTLSSKIDFQGKDGKWVPTIEYTCKK